MSETPDPPADQQATMSQLVAATTAVLTVAGTLVSLLNAMAKRGRRDRWIYVALIVVVIVSLGGNFLQARSNGKTNDTILSCVDPDGKCAKDAKAAQAQLVGQPTGPLNTVSYLSAYCANVPNATNTGPRNDSPEKVLACVDGILRTQKQPPASR